jgi:6-phosphogluconolactonase
VSAPDLRILPDPAAVAQAAAEEIARRDPTSIALAGGSTPRKLYERLATAKLRWSEMKFFWSDERCVPLADPESNARMAEEALLTRVPVARANVHAVETALEPVEAARRYEDTIRASLPRPEVNRLGADDEEGSAATHDDAWLRRRREPRTGLGVPRFDVVLLGMGPDRHTASLFPGSEAIREQERLVVSVVSATKPPPNRVTFTPPLLNAAHCVVFLVTGEEKADALAAVLEGERATPDRFPSKAVRPEAGDLLFFVDRAAARKLASR